MERNLMNFQEIEMCEEAECYDELLRRLIDEKEARKISDYEKDLAKLEEGLRTNPEIFSERRNHKRKSRQMEISEFKDVFDKFKKMAVHKFNPDEKIFLNRLNPSDSMSEAEYESPKNGKTPNMNRNGAIKNMLKSSLINLNAEWVDARSLEQGKMEFNSVDLFSGAGGISCGYKMAGIRTILGVEIDPVASETFRNNFPDSEHHCGDVKELSSEKIKKMMAGKTIHVVTGGFPCQGFSVAGFRDPDDKRNVLYKEVVRIVKALKPWFVVLENVPGVLTMKRGKVYKTIINDFESIGYPNMSVHVLEAADYGVPQFRPRTIFIANRFSVKNPYPKPHLKPEEYVPIEAAIKDLRDKPRDPSINHEWTRHKTEFVERIKKVKPGHSVFETFLDAYKRQYKGIPAMTIKENHGGTHIHYELDRCISAREMARLQSFPDDFIFAGTMKKAMWQIGNAVPPLMFKQIGLALIPKLKEINSQTSSS